MAGEEGTLFRKLLGWSILLVLVMCVIVTLQSARLFDWMVV
jgi:lactate permease